MYRLYSPLLIVSSKREILIFYRFTVRLDRGKI